MPVQMKNLIAEAFVSLTKQKSVDKITVKDIVEACHISRQTFYYHFRDIMDVGEWSMEQVMEDTLKRSLAEDDPREAMKIFISTAVEYHPILRRFLESGKRQEAEKLLVRMVRTYIQEMLRNKAPEIPMNYADMEISLDFCAYGIAGLLFENCGKKSLDIDRLTDQFYRLLSGKMVNLEMEK